MPSVELVFFQDDATAVPVRDWLATLRQRHRRAFAKCMVRIRRLALLGHELRRPEADYLCDGIYELRIREGRVNYRILYAFHGQDIAVLAHALTKEDRVPVKDIETAVARMAKFRSNPGKHSFREEVGDG